MAAHCDCRQRSRTGRAVLEPQRDPTIGNQLEWNIELANHLVLRRSAGTFVVVRFDLAYPAATLIF